jgi:hypothetical protein
MTMSTAVPFEWPTKSKPGEYENRIIYPYMNSRRPDVEGLLSWASELESDKYQQTKHVLCSIEVRAIDVEWISFAEAAKRSGLHLNTPSSPSHQSSEVMYPVVNGTVHSSYTTPSGFVAGPIGLLNGAIIPIPPPKQSSEYSHLVTSGSSNINLHFKEFGDKDFNLFAVDYLDEVVMGIALDGINDNGATFREIAAVIRAVANDWQEYYDERGM